MKRAILLFWFVVLAGYSEGEAPKRPNIIFILSDDLGFGDVGVFFQNQRRERGDRGEPWHVTPHLDAMAAQGIQLRDHYCPAPVCAPSRASLMLGVHQGHANVRDNQFDKAIEDKPTLASVMRGAGYATAAIGKWGLQGGPAEKSKAALNATPADWPGYPTQRGFDYYFGYVRHVDGHWHYPKEDGRQIWENDREISSDLAGCYTTDLFTARAKKWIIEQRATRPEQPFFLYLAYDTPHAKLELPPGEFPSGGGLHGGMQWWGKPGAMINTSGGTPDSFMHPDYAGATWDQDHNPATAEQPWPDVFRRYATDVRRIDDCVGDLLRLLADLNIDDQTLVIFTTDNGPSQESYLPEHYEADFFNSFGPFDGIKRDCWEGGIRVGAIARWPGRISAGQVNHEPSQFHDWMPTFAELGDVPAPARTDGVSLVPTLLGAGRQEPSRIYTEYFVKGKTPSYSDFAPAHRGRTRQQMQAIRLGDFVGVRYGVTNHAEPFEIYNIITDPQEREDLGQKPEFKRLQAEMHATVLGSRRPEKSAPRPYDTELIPAVLADVKPGIQWRLFRQETPWLAKLEWLKPASIGTQPTFDRAFAGAGSFSVLFSGYLRAPASGEYRMRVNANGECLLRIHEAAVFATGDEPQSVYLEQGMHPFRLYYRHPAGARPDVDLAWARAEEPLKSIPPSALWHGIGQKAQN